MPLSLRRPLFLLAGCGALLAVASAAGCAGGGSTSPVTITQTVDEPGDAPGRTAPASSATTVPSVPSGPATGPGASGPATGPGASGPATPPITPSTTAQAPATQVVVIRPFTADGSLKSGWRIDLADVSSTIDCSYDDGSPSAVGPGTHRCGASADSCHAAFTTPKQPGRVLCLHGAWDTVLHARTAVGLSSKLTPAPATPEPLNLELVDGTRWWLRTGGAWGGRADDYVGAYGCASTCGPAGKDIAVLVKNPPAVDRSTRVWTVRVGELGDPAKNYPPPVKTGVRTAWFIAAS